MKTLLISALLSLALPALTAAQEDPAPEVLAVQDGSVALSVGGSGIGMLDLLELSEELLGLPVIYNPQEIGDMRIFGSGTVRCELAQFRGLLDELLLSFDFVTWDTQAGEHAMHVRRVAPGRGVAGPPLPGQVVTLGQVPPRNTATYTAVFPLRHIDARSAMASFVPLLGHHHESLRNVGSSNALIVTALSMAKLQMIADLLAAVDVAPPEPSEELEDAVERLTDRVRALEELCGTR